MEVHFILCRCWTDRLVLKLMGLSALHRDKAHTNQLPIMHLPSNGLVRTSATWIDIAVHLVMSHMLSSRSESCCSSPVRFEASLIIIYPKITNLPQMTLQSVQHM